MEAEKRGSMMSEERGQGIWINFIVRAVVGMTLIYCLNMYFDSQNISIAVGMNFFSFLTSAVLGIPGVALLYGIMFYQIL